MFVHLNFIAKLLQKLEALRIAQRCSKKKISWLIEAKQKSEYFGAELHIQATPLMAFRGGSAR